MLQKICIRNLVRRYCRGVTAEREAQVTNTWNANVRVKTRRAHVISALCELSETQTAPPDAPLLLSLSKRSWAGSQVLVSVALATYGAVLLQAHGS